MKATEPQEVEKEEEQDENEDKPQPAPIKEKKHDSGVADLEKGNLDCCLLPLISETKHYEILSFESSICTSLPPPSIRGTKRLTRYCLFSNTVSFPVTDYAEDKEILSTGNELEDAIVAIRKKQDQKKAEKLARERELAKIAISKEDVDLIMSEMELPKDKAERTLREHGGDVVKALTALVNAPF